MRYLRIVATVLVSINKFKNFEEKLYVWNIYIYIYICIYIKLLYGFLVNFCTLYRSILIYVPCILYSLLSRPTHVLHICVNNILHIVNAYDMQNIVNIYRVSQEECARIRRNVPYVKVYQYNPKHLYPKLNGYGDNGQRKVGASCDSKYCNLHN